MSALPEAPRPTGLLLSDDLLFISRVTGTAHDLGFMVKSARSTVALLEMVRRQRPGCVILDLANPGLVLSDLLAQLQDGSGRMPRVVAYGSHVDTATLRAARAAGCDVVLPRSKFVEDLPRELPRWITPV